MVVTRRRAVPQPEPVRKKRSVDRRTEKRAGSGAFAHRRRERWLLALVSVALVLGTHLVSSRSAQEARQLAGGPRLQAADAPSAADEVVDLNRVAAPDELQRVLGAWTDPRERELIAERILEARGELGERGFPNVGALAALRIDASAVRDQGYGRLAQRLPVADVERESATDAEGGAAGQQMRLLSTSELRQLKPMLAVRTSDEFAALVWRSVVLMLGCAWLVHALWSLRLQGADEYLLPCSMALVTLGSWMMVAIRDPLRDLVLVGPYSVGVALGLLVCGALALVPIERRSLQRLSSWAVLAAFALSVLLLLFGSGPGTSDAKVNLFGFQPVEAIKLLVVLFLAGYFAERWELLRDVEEGREQLRPLGSWLSVPRWEYVLPPVLAIGLVLAFFFLQKDLGPALVLSCLFLVLYAVVRRRVGLALLGFATLLAGFFAGYLLRTPATVRGRIDMWLSPWDNSFRGGDHLAHSLWAFASGGWFGRGLGRGQPDFVPEAHTDMVLAALGEELGALGVLLALTIYALLVWRSIRAVERAPGTFSFLLGLGLVLATVLQIFLIVGGVLGVVPLSGVVTPFLSYGKSAMLANFAMLGALLSISAAGLRQGAPPAPAMRQHFATRPLLIAFSLLLAVLVVRVAWAQIMLGDELAARAVSTVQADGEKRFTFNPRLLEIARQLGRGEIVDRNGIVLATSERSRLEVFSETYSELGLDARQTGARRAVDERFYPLAGQAFHLLGDLNSRRGWGARNSTYLERDYSGWLQGFSAEAESDSGERAAPALEYSGLLPILRHGFDSSRRAVREIRDRDRTLRTTIDARLQVRTAEILAAAVARANAERGAAVVLDAHSGEVLALVSAPWPSAAAGTGSPEEQLDRVRYGLYPPGSTFKLVTAMAAQRAGVADRTYRCSRLDDGRVGQTVRGWGRAIRDDVRVTRPHGEVDLERGIAVSCNAYFAQLAVYDIGARSLLETAAEVGIEVARPNNPSQLQDALPQAAYGQGQVVVSPLDMARVAAAVASGGVAPRGHWVLGEANRRAEAGRRLIDENQASELAEAMRQVVTTGSAARALSGVSPAMAGKTGTAEVNGERSHAWFVGFAPYGGGGRKVAVAVLVENGGYGGLQAAEASGRIVREAARLGLL